MFATYVVIGTGKFCFDPWFCVSILKICSSLHLWPKRTYSCIRKQCSLFHCLSVPCTPAAMHWWYISSGMQWGLYTARLGAASKKREQELESVITLCPTAFIPCHTLIHGYWVQQGLLWSSVLNFCLCCIMQEKNLFSCIGLNNLWLHKYVFLETPLILI